MIELLVYREFDDGTDEIGILTCENGQFWVHVGDFDYYLGWQWQIQRYPFQILGTL